MSWLKTFWRWWCSPSFIRYWVVYTATTEDGRHANGDCIVSRSQPISSSDMERIKEDIVMFGPYKKGTVVILNWKRFENE
jgi:hypothetical protein